MISSSFKSKCNRNTESTLILLCLIIAIVTKQVVSLLNTNISNKSLGHLINSDQHLTHDVLCKTAAKITQGMLLHDIHSLQQHNGVD